MLFCTVSSILVAAREICDNISVLELSVLRRGWTVRVGIYEVLGDHGELCEDGAVPSTGG